MTGTAYRYFRIMTGLRGCYMPDQNYVMRMKTRRELRAVIKEEADNQSCEGMFCGLADHSVGWAAANAWMEGAAILPFGRRGGDRPYAIEIERISRAEFKEAQDQEQI